jgi:hypothetical protein
LTVTGPERLDLHVTLGQTQRIWADQRRPGRCQLLHARGQVRSLAHRGVVHVQIAADRAHDDLTGVEPDADLHQEALAPPYALGVAAHGLVHPQRGVAGAHGVVLMGERRTEQRHDPVAHDLVDSTLVVVHCFHHAFEHRVEDLARLFRVALREQFHRTLQIGEQHSDLLALTFNRFFGEQHALGKVLGDVLLWRGEARRG